MAIVATWLYKNLAMIELQLIKKMNYHLFNASMSHLAPDIIRGIFENAPIMHNDWKNENVICLWVPEKMLFGDKETELNKYRSVFEEFSFNNFKFIEGNPAMIKMVFGINTVHDKLIIHSDFKFLKRYFLFLLLLGFRGKKFLSQIVKIEWGVVPTQPIKTLKRKTLFLYKKYFYSNISYIVTLSPEDKQITLSKYPNANVIHANYLSSSAPRILNNEPKNYDAQKTLKILVSHSGHIHNNHLKSFELLSKYAEENIEIMCPLCYGPEENIEQIIKKGKEIFETKFQYFTELKSRQEYIKLVAEQDIYVTSATLQTGLSAAFTSISNGVKVYLGSNVQNFLRDMGYIVFAVDEISNANFQNFSKPISTSDFSSNQQIFINSRKDKSRIDTWKKIYGL